MSDLHLDFNVARRMPIELADPDSYDVTVIAGDICEGVHNAMVWIVDQRLNHKPVVAVLGNHEAYRGSIDREIAMARELSLSIPNLHFLEDRVAIIDSVRFIGATLWTDYELDGFGMRDIAMMSAASMMSDHQVIRIGGKEKFLPKHALTIHQQSRAYIEHVLATKHEGPTVVVTHHAPSMKAVVAKHHGSALNGAFASSLDDVVARADMWIHGHVHTHQDYKIDKCRVLVNPRGYPGEETGYVPRLVVEVGTKKRASRAKKAA